MYLQRAKKNVLQRFPVRPSCKWMRVFLYVAGLAALIVGSCVIALAQAPPAATGQRSDGQIEMDVVQALEAAPTLKDDMITPATIQGEVTLAGSVSSAASKDLAGSIVSKVNGVTAIHNNLKIGAPTEAESDPNAPPPSGNQSPAQGAPDQSSNGQAPRQQYAQAPPPSYPAQGADPNADQDQQYGDSSPMPTGAITIPPGTSLQMRTNEELDSKHAVEGNLFELTLIHDVHVAGRLAIPRGATLHGVVVEAKKAGHFGGSPEIKVKLTSLDLGGQSYPLASDDFKVKGPNKAGSTTGNVLGGALMGAIIGGAVGRGSGAAIGAVAGAGAGTAASAATPSPNAWIPAEAQVVFHLTAPLTVNPVSRQEAQRLAEGLYIGGPALYRRGPGYPPPPPPYYRPYVVTGGYYYWQ